MATATSALHPQQQQTVRRVENGRLVYYRAAADQHYWDAHWRDDVSPRTYSWADTGGLLWFEDVFTRHLPREGRILEAGCGLGQIVLALRVRGYDCEGVEWSAETVDRVRQIRPDLPVRVGDCTDLDVPDGYYRGYISLGVIEHREQGPEPFLREAHRVLADDGVMLVSVPHFHSLRRLKARIGFFRSDPGSLTFYQQAMSRQYLHAILRQTGFSIVDVVGYDPYKGLKDEIPLAKRLFNTPGVGRALERIWNNSSWAQRHLGHMIMFVCRKDTAR